MFPTLPQLGRLALLSLVVPTLVALALGERDWLFAAFTDFGAFARAPFLYMAYALFAPMLIVGIAFAVTRKVSAGRTPAMLAAAMVFGLLVWPHLDARAYAEARYEAVKALWHTNRPQHYIDREIKHERPDALIEGALIGFVCTLAWLGLEALAGRPAQQPLRFRDDRLT